MKDFLPLTYELETAVSTHMLLEQIVEVQCMLANQTDDYGFKMTKSTVLRIANTPETEFLLQAELRAIS
jgi:hypothetical protein